MNKTQAATTIAVVGFTAVAVANSRSANRDLYNRYPELDRKIVRQAFRKLMVKAATGQYAHEMQQWSDAKMDELFHLEYNRLINRQK